MERHNVSVIQRLEYYRRDDSYFIYHDIGYLVNEAARAVDCQMDTAIKESILLRKSGICCTPKTNIDNCTKTDKNENNESENIEFSDSAIIEFENSTKNNGNDTGLLASTLIDFDNSEINDKQTKPIKRNRRAQNLNSVIDV